MLLPLKGKNSHLVPCVSLFYGMQSDASEHVHLFLDNCMLPVKASLVHKNFLFLRMLKKKKKQTFVAHQAYLLSHMFQNPSSRNSKSCWFGAHWGTRQAEAKLLLYIYVSFSMNYISSCINRFLPMFYGHFRVMGGCGPFSQRHIPGLPLFTFPRVGVPASKEIKGCGGLCVG